MGAFEGGLTYKRYYVRDPLPAGWRDLFTARVRQYAFKEIPVESEEERALGWCDARFALETDLYPEHFLHNEYLALALRIDTLKVSGPLLKLHTKHEARRVMTEQKRESLSRYELAEIKDRLTKEMRKRIYPAIKTVDMVWHLDSGIVRFWNNSEKVNLEFQELFEQTFDLVLIPDGAYTAASHGKLGLGEADLARMLDVEPALFADPDALAGEAH